MSDLPVRHYLGIYQTRLRMADDGVTTPHPTFVAAMRDLVLGFSTLQPDVAVRLEIDGGVAHFKVADNGNLIGTVPFMKPLDQL